MSDLNQELEVALQAVYSAATISRAVQKELVGSWNKTDDSPVTVADLAVQAHVSAALAEAFPGDPLMAEESDDLLNEVERLDLVAKYVGLARPGTVQPRQVAEWVQRGQADIDSERRYWVLDPVDGTKGFVRKEQYAIALALVERGRILLGVLACPNLPESYSTNGSIGQLYFATRESPAWSLPIVENGPLDRGTAREVRVSAVNDPALATWCERVESSQGNKDLSTDALNRAGITAEPRRLDSQAKYAVVARGEAAVYLRHTLKPDYREKVWDHAAGVIVIEQAGGRVTDLSGKPLDFSLGRALENNRGIVATNGHLHDRVLQAVREVLA